MERYSVRIYPAALRDLERVVEELNALAPSAALRAYDLLTEQCRSLALMPEHCPRPRDLALRARGYRYLRLDNYLVLCLISGAQAQILRILHAKDGYAALF